LLVFWFAPLLTGWNGIPAMKSVFFSAVASYRNLAAFGVYGLVVAIAGVGVPGLILLVAGLIDQVVVEVVSVVVRMVLVFVMAPALTASLYISYRDVFYSEPLADGENADG
jgi:hypothetical protein